LALKADTIGAVGGALELNFARTVGRVILVDEDPCGIGCTGVFLVPMIFERLHVDLERVRPNQNVAKGEQNFTTSRAEALGAQVT
jgi:hypothetical protein